MKKLQCTALEVAPGLPLYHMGPALDHGPLPAIFYFALSGPDSLTLDPFNQPVQFLSDRWIRFFSLTLPAHESNLSPDMALSVWVEDINKGIDIFGDFIDQALIAVEYVVRQQLVDPTKLGIAGLSRGALFAMHIAARDERLQSILAFAPLSRIEKVKEFRGMENHPLVKKYDPFTLVPSLADRRIRFYIGNKDIRTDTHSCYQLAMHCVEASSLSSPQIELVITPSIGQMGHGTTPEIFRQGGIWLAEHIRPLA